MADRLGSIDAPVLSAGVSTQPAHLRYPSQVEAATNVWFDVLDGCSRRPGTRLVKRLTGMTAAATGLYFVGPDYPAAFGLPTPQDPWFPA